MTLTILKCGRSYYYDGSEPANTTVLATYLIHVPTNTRLFDDHGMTFASVTIGPRGIQEWPLTATALMEITNSKKWPEIYSRSIIV